MTAIIGTNAWGTSSKYRLLETEGRVDDTAAGTLSPGAGDLKYATGGLDASSQASAPTDTLKPGWSQLSSGDVTSVMANSNNAADWSKLHFGLAELYFEAQLALSGLSGAARDTSMAGFTSSNQLAPLTAGMVAIDIAASDGDGAGLLAKLEALGLEGGASIGALVGGNLPIDAIDDIAAMDGVAFARPAYAITNVGAVTARDGTALNATGLTDAGGTALDGTGLTVGVLSDSFDTSGNAIDYAADIASGDLPAGITLLDDTIAGSDEGRAMAQLIADIAPGADLAFHTAFGGQAGFAQGILDLAAAGADIIVDDILYFAEPFFQDGIIAQSVDTVDAAGVSYLSSAGNFADSSYEAAFDSSGIAFLDADTVLHDFDPGAGVDTRLSITQSGSVSYVLQWDESFFSVDGTTGSTNDIDIYAVVPGTDNIIASSVVANIGSDPLEIIPLDGEGTFDLVIGKFGTDGIDPGALKLVTIGGSVTFNEFATDSSTSYGHNNAEGALSVAASPWFGTPAFGQTPPLLEDFSSEGGTPIFFDIAGNRLATPETRDNVDFTSTDGGNTTFFGQQINDGDAFPNFFGTSAAAPTAAAVIALLKQAEPTATNEQIEIALESTAIDIVNRFDGDIVGIGNDATSGAGLIQADLALAALQQAVANQAIVINEVLFDPASGTDGDANGDGTRDFAQDEFIEIVNTGSSGIDISGWTLSDDDGGDFAFPAGTILASGQAAVLFGGGTPPGNVGDGQPNPNLGGALVFVDDGSIGSGLSNSGDVIELRDGGGALVNSVGYGNAGAVVGGSDQSVTRDPDGTGNFIDHSTATGSGGALFSAGTQVDGSAFVAPVTIVLDETFETDGAGTRYTFSTGEGSDGSGDFFTRTDGSTIGSFYEVAGQGGDFFFAAQDTDSVPGLSSDDEQSIFFTGLDISGL
ncbi:MAG: lamin tail domain-containing protein, partial [Pseudomonadota bacterium]